MRPIDIKIRVIAGALALLGAVAFFSGAVQVFRGLRSSAWPQVPGKVLEYERSAFGFAAGRDTPHIVYEYHVDGQRFEGSAVSTAGTRPQHDGGHIHLVPGQVIQVSYDPSRPARSVIIRGANSTSYFIILLGGVLMLSAFMLTRRHARSCALHRDP